LQLEGLDEIAEPGGSPHLRPAAWLHHGW